MISSSFSIKVTIQDKLHKNTEIYYEFDLADFRLYVISMTQLLKSGAKLQNNYKTSKSEFSVFHTNLLLLFLSYCKIIIYEYI